MSSLALTRQAMEGEIWRLWTGHLAHFDWQHLLWNVVASVVPLVVLRARLGAVVGWAFLAAPMVSLAVLAQSPFAIEYRGASALVVGLWIAAGLHLWRRGQHPVALVILICVLVKMCLETAGLWTFTAMSVAPSPVAHWCGALAGVVCCARFRREPIFRSSHSGGFLSSSRSFSKGIVVLRIDLQGLPVIDLSASSFLSGLQIPLGEAVPDVAGLRKLRRIEPEDGDRPLVISRFE